MTTPDHNGDRELPALSADPNAPSPEPGVVVNASRAAAVLANYFLSNTETGNHAANDELIAELGRYRRRRGTGS
ncbi:MAG: hypothetical protein ACRDRZ_01410 [Pseudonocardiaceae bacterium]